MALLNMHSMRKRSGIYAGVFRHAMLGSALILSCSVSHPQAGETSYSEYEIKAAMIFKIARFVEWPEEVFDREEHFNIGILGKDPFGKSFDAILKDKSIHGHPVKLRRSRTADGLKDCHIVFIAASENDRLKDHLKELNRQGVLVIGETAGFIDLGGCVNFVEKDRRVNFEINRDVAEKARLKISAQLLQLAVRVKHASADENGEEG